MNCPDCKSKLLLDKLIKGNTWGVIAIWWMLFLVVVTPLILIGVIGWIIIVLLGIYLLRKNYGKRRYKCSTCGYKVLIQPNANNT